MLPDKDRAARNADLLVLIMATAAGLYILVAALVTFGRPNLARDPDLIPLFFLTFVGISSLNIGVLVFFHRSKRVLAARAEYDPLGRAYLICQIGAILSEAHSIYGLILTILSGSIYYILGFSVITWSTLFWVRARFKRSWENLSNR